jgi:hypothetical protein
MRRQQREAQCLHLVRVSRVCEVDVDNPRVGGVDCTVCQAVAVPVAEWVGVDGLSQSLNGLADLTGLYPLAVVPAQVWAHRQVRDAWREGDR